MKKFFLLIIFGCHMSAAFFGSSPLTTAIDSLIYTTNPYSMVGIEIRDLESGKIIYEKNPHILMRPASLEKIPTALVVLSQLGPTYQFETSLLEKEHTVYLRFSGDPTFTLQDLNGLFKTYKHKKGGTITGNIVINQESVPVFPHVDGWSVEATRFLYGAPISVININKNTICLRVVPAKTDKQKPLIIYDKNQPPYKIDNHSISKACLDEEYIERCDLDLEEQVSIKGCVPNGSPAFKVCLPVKEHRFKEYIRKCIQTSLAEAGIHLKGKIFFRPFSKQKLHIIAQHLSDPLYDIVKNGMKESDDTIMESVLIPFMLKRPHKFRKPKYLGTFMANVLQDSLGVDLSRAILMDGSGLSHHNLISAHQVAELLWAAWHHKSLREPFLASMAVGGDDGTLKARLKNLPEGVQVLAKTGTLTGIRGLAGYIVKNRKPKYLFAMMMQNFSEDGKNYEELQDKIVIQLSHLIS
jgi:D-alanyl-D-alanine carboxypeptidase/D-alanyl-D-alanine-endopeptidase (penicillin-binding protein 4)